MDSKRPSALIINKGQQEYLSIGSGSPSSPRTNGRRRKTKMNISTKSNEELIIESQQQLLEYVDRIDEEVKKIVKSHEAEFLLAYRNHLKLVKSEMEELKQRSLESMNQHKQYIQHIEGLEKQLILFREESLKLSQKNVQQAQKIEKLSYEIKLIKTQKQKEEAKVNELTLKNKELKTLLYQYQSNHGPQSATRVAQKSNIASLNKTIEVISNVTKGETFNTSDRPYTTQLKFKGKELDIRSKSVKKNAFTSQVQQQEQKLQNSGNRGNRTGPRFQQPYCDRKIKSENQSQTKDRFSLRERMLKRIRHTANYTQKQLQAMQSKNFADRNEYQCIFKNCVEEVRKEVLRRNGMLGLNYFKLNGPRDLMQFKKVDYYMLLQLFLKNELIIQTFYQLVFARKDDF